tara:strand:+ start:695 stop:874 length:180 start_codon:yes stop_codon:yes gene_type:complete
VSKFIPAREVGYAFLKVILMTGLFLLVIMVRVASLANDAKLTVLLDGTVVLSVDASIIA